MTKKEFVNAFAEKGELKIKDSERLVNAFLETVEDALLKGDGVRFIGFGSWEVKERSAREVKNPQTGKMIKVEAKKVVKFNILQYHFPITTSGIGKLILNRVYPILSGL